MKANYSTPSTEVMQTKAYAIMVVISGPEGLNDGGQDTGSEIPQ